MKNEHINGKKYLFTLIITVILFGTAILLSNYFSKKKIEEIRNIQDKISIDILSSETQFSLLEESSCKDIGSGRLSKELGSLEEKLSTTEKERGLDDAEVQTLKRYYALLEIKDYLLLNRISQKCKTTPLSIIYFYTIDETCPNCEREGYVLSELRQEFPELRIYSFDYNSDLSAVKTLISINKVKEKFPALIIKDETYYGFQGIEDLMNLMPELQKLADARSEATTTNSQ